MTSFYVWIISIFAFLVLNGNCNPVEQVSVSTSHQAGEITRERDSSTTETLKGENDFTLSQGKVMVSGPTETTDKESTESEAPVSSNDNKYPDGDYKNDSKEKFETQTQDYDYKNYNEATTKKRYRFFTFIDGKTKREIHARDVGDGLIEVNTTENNDKEIMEAESDFIQHDYDYTVKSDYEKRKKREGRIKRQSGESLPHMRPNRNPRDMPAYPANLVPVNENVATTMESQEEEEGKRKEEEEEQDDDDDDDDEKDGKNEKNKKNEKEKEC